jgi:cytochrome c biogenesis protein CcmG, thiol:disulfide interchange protein DsbE
MGVEGISSDGSLGSGVVGSKKGSRKHITLFIVISVVNVALLVLLATQLLTPVHNKSDIKIDNTTVLGDVTSPLIGQPAPDFTLSTLGNNASKVHLTDFKGKAVILNFWASWCGPCNQEAPFLQKAWPGLHSQGIVFLGVDSGDISSEALKFLKQYGVTYPNVQDTFDSATAISYGGTGFPTTIFINKDGIVVAKWINPLTAQGLQLEMAKLSRPVK